MHKHFVKFNFELENKQNPSPDFDFNVFAVAVEISHIPEIYCTNEQQRIILFNSPVMCAVYLNNFNHFLSEFLKTNFRLINRLNSAFKTE